MTMQPAKFATLTALLLLAVACNKKTGDASAGASASAQTADGKKPIVIGITADASGQYANSCLLYTSDAADE